MKMRVLLFLIFALTLFAVGALIDILFNTSPGSIKVMVAFYAALFFTLAGLVFFSFYSFIYLHIGNLPSRLSTVLQIRLSIYLALWLSSMLALSAYHLLNIISAIVILATLVIFELSLKQSNAGIINSGLKKTKPEKGISR